LTKVDAQRILQQLKGGLIVSCQAAPESALHAAIHIAALAKEAERGGAVGLRINGPENVRQVRQVTSLPIIGINKQQFPGSDVYITPTRESAQVIIEEGAPIIAIDATDRTRPGHLALGDFIQWLHRDHGVVVMADVSTLAEGIAAAAAGADIIATTLSGYTASSPMPPSHEPDFALIRHLYSAISLPIIAEGRIGTPDQAVAALQAGAHAVVVGTAITAPAAITQRFCAALSAIR
jgi:N-acylglucosamine-6-phosphate 2-epimerase